VVGQAPAPTLSDRGDGNTRVTFDGWELDWEFYGEIAVDGTHFMYNVTAGATAAIIAKGGAERTGYYFDLNLAFGTWAAGNLMAPVRGNWMNQNNTLAGAFAAAANLDSLLIWYVDAANNLFWGEIVSANTTKGVDVLGMTSERRTSLSELNHMYYLNGNLAGITRQIIFRNLALFCGKANAGHGIWWNDTSGAGLGIRVTRCVIHSAYIAFRPQAGLNNCCQIDNCIIVSSSRAGIFANMPALCYFTTVIGSNSSVGANAGFEFNFLASTCVNCVAAWNPTGDFIELGGMAAFTNNGSSDATGTAGLQNLTRATFAFWQDNDYGNFGYDFRVVRTSTLLGAGVAVAGLTYDIDGNTRADPPTPGAHEGTEKPYQNYVPAVPTNVACTDAGTDQDLAFTWTNPAGTYLAADMVIIYDNTGTELGRGLADRGILVITGFANFTFVGGMYATAISDNGIESAASNVVSNTPTRRVSGHGQAHIICDGAADEEEILHYLWFISSTAALAETRRLAAQAQIDAREEITDWDYSTEDPDVTVAGLEVGLTYWVFVVAVDEDNLGTDTNALDILQITAQAGDFQARIRVLDKTMINVTP